MNDSYDHRCFYPSHLIWSKAVGFVILKAHYGLSNVKFSLSGRLRNYIVTTIVDDFS